MVRLNLMEVRKVCMDYPGMWDAFLTRGTIEGSLLAVPRKAFDEINRRFFNVRAGTMLHNLLKPIVKLPDKLIGTSLGSCGKCAERELKLNAALSK